MSNVRIKFRDEYKNKDGESPLLAVVHINGKKIRIPTGINADPELWDPDKQIIKGKSKQVKDNNLILADCVSKINDILVKYRLQHKTITPDLLKYEYAHYSASIDFIAFMEKEITDRKSNGEIESTTARQHTVSINKLKEFKSSIAFSEIDEAFILKFKNFLKDVKKNDTWTISSNLKSIKIYIRRAIKKRIINEDPFGNIKIVHPKKDRTFLTETEISQFIAMYNKHWLPSTHQKVLRHFLFSIATGLRISDVKKVTMENISHNLLIFLPFKTRNQKQEVVRMPLSTLAKQMIKDESPNRLHGPIFTMISEFRTNKYLREIAAELKIKKHISFHTGRHTFATYFLRKTKNLVALQKLLGHSDLRETMVYAHILTEDIEKEMECFEDLIR